MSNIITVRAQIAAPVEKVWEFFTEPIHIMKWNNATEDWHTPKAANDLRAGGSFVYTMAARDGSFSFDFGGTYTEVSLHQKLAYTLEDGRRVGVVFTEKGGQTDIEEWFEPESENPEEMQRQGWQAILDNFARYVAAN